MDFEKLKQQYALHNINLEYYPTIIEVKARVQALIQDNQVVGVGGSTTLSAWGIIDELRARSIQFLDRFVPGITTVELNEIFHQSLNADIYLSSVNAMTENGELLCMDKNGNRVAALLYGPKKVILVVGKNKLVKNLDEAFNRIRTIAGPANARRLNLSTPCVSTGVCMQCDHPQKLCNIEVIIKGQADISRMTLLLVDEAGGF